MQQASGIKCPSIDNTTLCSSFGEQTHIPVAGATFGACDNFYENLALKVCPFATIPDTTRYSLLAIMFLSTSFGSASALFLILVFLSDPILWRVNHCIIFNLAVADFVLLAVFGSFKIHVLVGMVLSLSLLSLIHI